MESITQHYLFKIHLKFSLSEKFSLGVTPLCGWEIWMLYQLGPWSLVGLNVLGRFWVKDHTVTPGPPGWELNDGFMSHIMTEIETAVGRMKGLSR